WLPKLMRVLRHEGILSSTQTLAVWQCTGGDDRSAGTHTRGGCVDIKILEPPVWDPTHRYKQLSYRSLAVLRYAREMGGLGWPRYDIDGRYDGDDWENNEHYHIPLNGCIHNYPCRYQIDEYKAGEDGLAGSGR